MGIDGNTQVFYIQIFAHWKTRTGLLDWKLAQTLLESIGRERLMKIDLVAPGMATEVDRVEDNQTSLVTNK